jgi:Ni/Co efflux regulator RcnB
MRNLLIGILLAGAAVTPALAQDNGDHRWHHDQQNNGNRGEGHQQRQQAQPQQQQVREQGPRFNGGNFNRPQFVAPQQQQVQAQQDRRGGWNRQGFEGRQFEGRQNVAPQGGDVQEQAYRYRGPAEVERNRNGGWTRSYPQQNNVVVQQQYQQQYQQRTWNRDAYRQGQYGQQQYYRNGGTRYAGNWNRDWRNDRRYDWRRYRDSHRSVFHLGLYIDPFGYGYQPFSIGYRLPPVYFGQQYWIDPALYGLPYPPPGTQWVRYWNDALLIDMYTGEVVDSIQGFFW